VEHLELTTIEVECMRCRRRASVRVPGLCDTCREELRQRFAAQPRDVETEAYEPKMNVTPNAVALKDD
jgi:hypothetical protein